MKMSKVLIVAGLVCCLIAVIFAGRNFYESYQAGLLSAQVMDDLQDYSQAASAGPVLSLPQLSAVVTDMETVEIDGHSYAGSVSIPSVSIDLPVMADWSYENLKIAPCVYEGSVFSSDLVICAHNYRSHFGRLKNVQVDDVVVFTDVNGTEFRYRVGDIEILDGNDTFNMANSDWDLTLFTCTLDSKSRVTVRCQSDTDS